MTGTDASGALAAVAVAGIGAAAVAVVAAGWIRARRAGGDDEGDPAVRRAWARPDAHGGTDPVLASLGLDYPDHPGDSDDAGYPGGRAR